MFLKLSNTTLQKYKLEPELELEPEPELELELKPELELELKLELELQLDVICFAGDHISETHFYSCSPHRTPHPSASKEVGL